MEKENAASPNSRMMDVHWDTACVGSSPQQRPLQLAPARQMEAPYQSTLTCCASGFLPTPPRQSQPKQMSAATRLTLQAHENAWLVRWGDALTEKIAAESSESVAAHYQNGNLADSLHTRLARLATEQGYLSKVIPGAQF